MLQKIQKKYKGKLPKLDELSNDEQNALWNCDVQYKNTCGFIKSIHKSLVQRFLAKIQKSMTNKDFVNSIGEANIGKVQRLCSSSIKEIRDNAKKVNNLIKVAQKTKEAGVKLSMDQVENLRIEEFLIDEFEGSNTYDNSESEIEDYLSQCDGTDDDHSREEYSEDEESEGVNQEQYSDSSIWQVCIQA